MVKLLDTITGEAYTEIEWIEDGKGIEIRNEFIEVEHFEGEL